MVIRSVVNMNIKNILLGLGKTPRQATLQSRQTFSQIQYVITNDLALNRDRIMRIYGRRTKRVKFRDPHLNRSRAILPKAVGCGFFDHFLTSITANWM